MKVPSLRGLDEGISYICIAAILSFVANKTNEHAQSPNHRQNNKLSVDSFRLVIILTLWSHLALYEYEKFLSLTVLLSVTVKILIFFGFYYWFALFWGKKGKTGSLYFDRLVYSSSYYHLSQLRGEVLSLPNVCLQQSVLKLSIPTQPRPLI